LSKFIVEGFGKCW